jgi:ribosomal protein S18 acetylase RimI-like enzyme
MDRPGRREPAGTWVALRIVGFLSVEGEDPDQLYLDPGFYRRGIGSRLLDKAKALSPSGLHLFAFQRNSRARAFYEAHGFTVFDLNDGSRKRRGRAGCPVRMERRAEPTSGKRRDAERVGVSEEQGRVNHHRQRQTPPADLADVQLLAAR